jgi:hypothetical protein
LVAVAQLSVRGSSHSWLYSSLKLILVAADKKAKKGVVAKGLGKAMMADCLLLIRERSSFCRL